MVFGDSFTANPDQYRNTLVRFSKTSSQRVFMDYPNTGNCLQGPDNWPRLLQSQTGVPVADWSCTGHNSNHLNGRIQRAIRSGALTPATRAVVLSVGFNDYWPGSVLESGTGYDQGRIRGHYINNVKSAAAKIRAVAPRAKIIMPGMLSITEDYGAQQICAVNVIPNIPAGFPLAGLQQWESRVRSMQAAAAREVGARFIDIKAQSRFHNTCAKDAERWVSGVLDTTTPHYNMAVHPSRAGSAHVANQVARAL